MQIHASSRCRLEAHPQVPSRQPVLLFHRQEWVKPVQPGGNAENLSTDQKNQQVLGVSLLKKQPVSQSMTGLLSRRANGRANNGPPVVGCFVRQSVYLTVHQ